MFLIGTRYVGSTWLLLTHGARGSTTPLRSEQWLTWWNTWQTHQKCDVWFLWCRKAVVFLPDAVGLSTGTPLITLNFLVTCLWPCRVQGEYWLVDTMAKGSLKLSTETYFRPLGLHHFYEAFSNKGKANLRQDSPCPVRVGGSRANEWSATHSWLQCFVCNGANTRNNPKLLLRVQQEEIESHLVSFPLTKGKRSKVLRKKRPVRPALIREEQDGSWFVRNRMDRLKILLALPSPKIIISVGSC